MRWSRLNADGRARPRSYCILIMRNASAIGSISTGFSSSAKCQNSSDCSRSVCSEIHWSAVSLKTSRCAFFSGKERIVKRGATQEESMGVPWIAGRRTGLVDES